MTYKELTCQTLRFGGFDKKEEKPHYTVLGVPYDFTSTYRPGSRFGPEAIRQASVNLEAYCPRASFDVETLEIEDIGDLNVVTDAGETTERTRRVVKEIIDEGKFPIVLGGEHTVTYGSSRAFEDVAIVSFDAHLDLRDEYLGNKLSHAATMRRLSETFGPDKILVVGPRAFCAEELAFAKENNVQFITPWDISRTGFKASINRLKNWVSRAILLYITVDMDVLDPSYAPGVGNPVPEGLSPTQLLDILHEICGQTLAGFDVVEVSPAYDSGITALQASNIIYNVVAFKETSIM